MRAGLKIRFKPILGRPHCAVKAEASRIAGTTDLSGRASQLSLLSPLSWRPFSQFAL